MIERQGTDKVRASCKGNDADASFGRASINCRVTRLTVSMRLAEHLRSCNPPPPSIQNIKHEHDIDAARLHPLQRTPHLRPGQSNDQQGDRGIDQRKKNRPAWARRFFPTATTSCVEEKRTPESLQFFPSAGSRGMSRSPSSTQG